MHQTATALAPACLQSRSYRPEHPGRSKWRRCVSCPDYTLPARCRVRAWESRPEAPRRTEETHLRVGCVLSVDFSAPLRLRMSLESRRHAGPAPWRAITARPKASSRSPSPSSSLPSAWPSHGSRDASGEPDVVNRVNGGQVVRRSPARYIRDHQKPVPRLRPRGALPMTFGLANLGFLRKP